MDRIDYCDGMGPLAQAVAWILQLSLLFVTVTLSLFLFHALYPFLSPTRIRYFIVSLTFALILFAYVLLSMPRWQLLAPVFGLVWLAGGFHIYQQAEQWQYAGHHSLLIPHPPLHRFADALRGKARAQDAILGFTQASFLNNGLHFGFSTVDYYSQAVLGIQGAFIWTGYEGGDLREEFDRRVGNHPYLLFTYEPNNVPDNFAEVKELLEQDYRACEVLVDTEVVFAQRYATHALDCEREHREIEFINGIKIMDAFAEYDAEAHSLRVVTGWEVADKPQLEQFNVSIQIITPDWQRVRQAPDRHLYDNVLPWYVVELSTAGLPPGTYHAMVILYDRETVKKIPGVDRTKARQMTFSRC